MDDAYSLNSSEPQNTVDKLDKCSVELTIIYKNAWTVSGQPVGLLAGRAGTTPLSPPLQPPQPGKAAQRKKVHAHATTVLSRTRGVIPLLNLEAIDHPLATYNCLDRINVLESNAHSYWGHDHAIVVYGCRPRRRSP